MKKFLKGLSAYGNLMLSIFNALMFFAMKYCWSGISKNLGCEKGNFDFLYHLPVYICILFFIVCILNFALFFVFKTRRMLYSYIFNAINILFLAAVLIIIKLGAVDYMYFIWPKFWLYLAITLICFALSYLVVGYPKSRLKDSLVFKTVLILIIALVPAYFVFNASINYITYKPVVYAVDNEYQIVFTTSTKSTGWVTVGDESFYDTYAGYMRSEETVHKISVPMEKLNDAKSYTVHTKKMIYRGPFGAFQGKDKTMEVQFRPVDTNDGFNYYCLSDIHMDTKGAVNSAKQDPDMELLVLCGDNISLVDSERDVNYVNKIAYEITKGEIPVVYARGNHELKCSYSDKLYRYVGSSNENFYYTFALDNVYGVVLDLGEDHEDDYFEYYNCAQFDEYRDQQTKFLKDLAAGGEYKKYDYRMLICHIPPIYINSKKEHESYIKDWTDELNKFGFDICLSGHKHDLMVFEPDTLTPYEELQYNTAYDKTGDTINCSVTDFNFPTFLVSKRGTTQTDDNTLKNMDCTIGMKTVVDFKNHIETISYNGSHNEEINMVNPFVTKDGESINYGTSIVIDLKTKQSKR